MEFEEFDRDKMLHGEMIMRSMAQAHAHKNFTILGLLAYYIAGFIFFGGVYLISFDVHWHWYKKDRKRMNMFVYAVRFTRIVHAVLATVVAIPIMLYTEDFLGDRFLILDLFVALSGGFLTLDIFGRYNEHLQVYEPPGRTISYTIVRRYLKKQWLVICHHVGLVVVVYPVVLFARDDQGDFLVACLLFTELSTPFTQMQWLMEHTLRPLNVRYVVVCMMGIATTFVSRVLVVPFIYEALADHMNRSITDLILTLGPWWHLTAACYFIPNIYWLFQSITSIVIYLNTRGDGNSDPASRKAAKHD